MSSTTSKNDAPVNKKSWLAARLDEPTTYAGLGIIAVVIGPFITEAAHAPSWGERAFIILSGILAVLKSEGFKP